MATDAKQPSVGLEKLFKRAKRFYHSQLRSNDGYLSAENNQNIDGASKEVQNAPGKLSTSAVFKSSEESDRKPSKEPKSQTTSISNKPRDSMTKSESKDVNDILTPEAARPEIRSVNGILNGGQNSACLSDYPGLRKSKTLNADKLTEIINNSIKAAVQNLAIDSNSAHWKQEKEQKNILRIGSTLHDACPQRLNSTQNTENVTSFTQYSEQAVSSAERPMLSSHIRSISANNGSSGRNSHQLRSSQCESPTCCIPSSKTDTISSAIRHESVSDYKQIDGRCAKKQPANPSKPYKPKKTSKPSKPCKPCRHGKTDNRKMTGNVNIYICSEGNDGGTNNKTTESTCDSTTATNASCACSSSDVCATQSTASAKTIRNLMVTRKKSADMPMKCICGKRASECECFPVQTKINESEELGLSDTSSLNPTTSNATDYNLQTPNKSESSPRGDYCTGGVRSSSSSQQEPCCTRQNCGTSTGGAELENNPEIYANQPKLLTDNSGRGDAVRGCCCCKTFLNYSDGKLNACSCCDVGAVADPAPRKQREPYPLPSNIQHLRRSDDLCDCCACGNDSLHSSSRKSDAVQPVCCQNRNANKQAQNRLPRKDYCTQPRDITKRADRGSSDQQRSGYSDFCIMEEDEACDAPCSKPAPTTKLETLSRMNSSREDSTKCCRQESDANQDRPNSIKQRSMSINDREKRDDQETLVDDGVRTSQPNNNSMSMSVAEGVKSNSNADRSTSSNYMSLTSSVSHSPPRSKSKPVVQTKTNLVKESRKSSLKWPFSKAERLNSGGNRFAEFRRDKSSAKVLSAVSKPKVDTPTMVPVANTSASTGISKISGKMIAKSTNGVPSTFISQNATVENSSSGSRDFAKGNSLFVIKMSDTGGDKSREAIIDKNTKLSSSKLRTLIEGRKNSVKSATNNDATRSYTDNTSSDHCCCVAKDADMCTCGYPQCPDCARPQEDCKFDDWKDRPQKQSCNSCKQANILCCCCDAGEQEKTCPVRFVTTNAGFRACTLCCRPEKNCCCNSTSQTSRRSESPLILGNKSGEPNELFGRKSQLCLFCEERRENCTCRAPIKKCSYCGMASDVCNCQEVTSATCNTCSYDENICQCNGRLIINSDGGRQNMWVTAWKPRRDVRKYFSRKLSEKDEPDCSCYDAIRPYGSDELPYQRLSVFSDVMTELQQKMSEPTCCNRCGKTPCCCHLQESDSYPGPANESRVGSLMQRQSRNRSPPCRQCPGTRPCKCGGRKTAYQICIRCRTTPCRCRRSRSIQRKPQAKCYYCKCSPCRCESNKPTTTPKSCRYGGSEARSQGQAGSPTPDRNSPGPRPRSCRCRCGSSSYGSTSGGQERPCAKYHVATVPQTSFNKE